MPTHPHPPLIDSHILRFCCPGNVISHHHMDWTAAGTQCVLQHLRSSGCLVRGGIWDHFIHVCVCYSWTWRSALLLHTHAESLHMFPNTHRKQEALQLNAKNNIKNCFFSQRLCFCFSPFLSRLCMFPRSPYRRTDSSFGIEVTFPPSNWLPLHQCGAGRCLRKTISRIKIIPVETSSSGRV